MRSPILLLAFLFAVPACDPAATAPCPATPSAAALPVNTGADDVLAARDIEVIFHDAGSTKDIERMMSIFSDDPVLEAGGKTYKGRDEVRHYFADVAPPFQPQNQMIAYTPAQRIKVKVDGDTATLYFECLWLDTKAQQIASHTFSDDALVRVPGPQRWKVKSMKAGPVAGL